HLRADLAAHRLALARLDRDLKVAQVAGRLIRERGTPDARDRVRPARRWPSCAGARRRLLGRLRGGRGARAIAALGGCFLLFLAAGRAATPTGPLALPAREALR